jgi:hypothetical protein
MGINPLSEKNPSQGSNGALLKPAGEKRQHEKPERNAEGQQYVSHEAIA